MPSKAQVLIIMGSDSDWEEMRGASEVLDELGISHAVTIASAHRTPERVTRLSQQAQRRGVGVIIAGAGAAATLAGVIAAQTPLPVLGVPLSATPLNGFDALLATVQMPAGIPVATMSVGKPGARNAALFAARVLALSDPAVAKAMEAMRQKMRAQVEQKDKALQQKLQQRDPKEKKGA
jgi:phosphoribosylaminoimidazole carboxylase PurE protein